MTATARRMDDQEIDRTLALLGGRKFLKRPVTNRIEAHDLIEAGLPVLALSNLVSEVAILGGVGGYLEKAVGMSLRTFQRRRDDPSRPLSAEQSGRTWKFAEILGRAAEVFGSRAAAEDWLKEPAIALDQRRPIDLLATPAGVEAVEDHLTRLEFGVYA